MPGISPDITHTSTPLPAPDRAERRTRTTVCCLPGDCVEAGEPTASRATLRGRISTLFSAIASRIASAMPSLGRLPNTQRAVRQFTVELSQTLDTLASPGATADAIENALVHAGAALRAVRSARGVPRAELERATAKLRQSDSGKLRQLAIALRGPALQRAQSSLADRPEAALVLMEIERTVNSELTRQIDSTIDQTLRSALDGLQSGRPPERIEDDLHFAFDSAVPLVRIGVAHGGDTTDAAIDHVVLERLDRLPKGDRAALLDCMNTKDLARLQRASTLSPTALSVTAQVTAESSTRPTRLAEAFAQQALEFARCYNGEGPIDSGAFVWNLAKLGAARDALLELWEHQHPRTPHSTSPSLGPVATSAQSTAATCIKAALESGRINLERASPDQLVTISRAFDALGIPRDTLGRAQQTHLDMRRAAFQQQLGSVFREIARGPEPRALFGSAFWEIAGGQEPRALLSSLAALEHASSALRDAVGSTAFVDEQREQIHDYIRARLPLEERTDLALALIGKQTVALICALHVGAAFAFNAHEPDMGNRLLNMARLLEDVRRKAGIPFVDWLDGDQDTAVPPWASLHEYQRVTRTLSPQGPGSLQRFVRTGIARQGTADTACRPALAGAGTNPGRETGRPGQQQ